MSQGAGESARARTPLSPGRRGPAAAASPPDGNDRDRDRDIDLDDEDGADIRKAKMRRRRSSSAAEFSRKWSDDIDRLKEELNTREKALNVKRAVKMEKVSSYVHLMYSSTKLFMGVDVRCRASADFVPHTFCRTSLWQRWLK